MGLTHLEFKQTQIADEFGLFKAVINIVDRKKGLLAEWPPARLDVWLDLIRDDAEINATNLFDAVDIEWQQPQFDDDIMNESINAPDLNESLNSSRISINLTAMKEAILGKSNERSFKTIRNIFNVPFSPTNKNNEMLKSALVKSEVVKKRLMYDDDQKKTRKSPTNSPGLAAAAAQTRQRKFDIQAHTYLKDLRKTILKFKKMCQDENNWTSDSMRQPEQARTTRLLQSIDQMEQISNDIKNTLYADDDLESAKTPKSVRFLLD